MDKKQQRVVIIGAGPAGLTAGYLLSKRGIDVVILEADPTYVGGISRTVDYKGYRIDIGGHRFFSKSKAVEALWSELLPDDMLERPRSSRIYYQGQFFSYPLEAVDALTKLGLAESTKCVLSYLHARLNPTPDPANFEDWVVNQFGRRLFETFFKTYTEKVWGMDCKEISADWAAQRIHGLSLKTAITNALAQALGMHGRTTGGETIKTLIQSFRYPRLGPGMMWEAAARKVSELGGEILMGRRVTGLRREGGRWAITHENDAGERLVIDADHVISSAPVRELVRGLSPTLAERTMKAGDRLEYRDFLVVGLIGRERHLFSENWLYIHDPAVRVGRIQNFKSWSPAMVPDEAMCCYGLEYFCFENDGLWARSDDALIELARGELQQLGLAAKEDIIDGCVVRQKKAYPVYDHEYALNVNAVRAELEARFPTLHLVGRNGMHKYNNQDHAMMTAMLTVENIVAGRRVYDPFLVNQDAEYHETLSPRGARDANATLERLVPRYVG